MGKQTKVKPSPKEQQEEETVSFFKLLRYASNLDRFFMVLGTIGAAGDGASMPVFILFFGSIPNALGPTADPNSLIKMASDLALKFLYIGLISGVCSYVGYASWMAIGEKQAIEIRKRYFKSLLQQEIAFYDSINPNELATKISEECFNIQQGVGEKVASFCASLATLIAGFIIGYIKGWQLALVLTGFMPVIGVVGSVFVIIMQKTTQVNNEAFARAGAISEEALNAIRTIVSLGGQRKESERYKKVLNANGKLITKYSIYSGVAVGFIVFAMFAVYALGFFVGSIFVKKRIYDSGIGRDYDVSAVLTVFFAILMASFTPTQMTPSFKAFAAAKVSGAKAFKIIDRKSKINIANETGLKPASIEGVMQFRDVKFAYPLKQERVILNGISFDIRKNEKTAFVGESGCGKTTCMQLIERFYDIEDKDHGSITLDGNELKSLNLKWMRENIGYVGQEPVLFATSIKENLLMAKDDATEAQLWDALEKANSAEFVRGLPDKLNTFVGANGTMLSGGQKQRLAIARAILKNPKILLLDEATSALDRKNEMEIQKTLDSISEGRTTIVIAHRLSTIINADHIIVFDGGKVVEEGKHEDLVARKGRYYALQHLQLQAEEKDKRMTDDHVEVAAIKPMEDVTRKGSRKDSKKVDQTSAVAGQEQVKTDAGKPKHAEKDSQIFIRLLSFCKGETHLLILGTIMAVIQGTVQPLVAPLLANMLFVLAVPDASNYNARAGLFSGLFLALSVLALVAFSFQMSCFNVIAERMSRRVRLAVFQKYVRMPIGWFDDPKNSPGALGSRLSTDAALINTVVSSVFGVYFQAAGSLIAAIVISFVADWKLALIGIAISPFLLISGFARGKLMASMVKSSDDAYQESISFASEAVNNMRTVVSFGKEDKLLENYCNKLVGPLKAAKKNAHQSGAALGVGQVIQLGANALTFYCGACFIKNNGLTFKNMFMAIMSIMMGCMAVGNAMQNAGDAGAAKNAAINIFEILDTKPAIDIDEPSQDVRTPITGNIEFKNVWFKYPSREKQIFSGLNLSIKAGNKTAFVGPSGCGKSTILALIQRFYDVDSGEILIDGVNIKKYDLRHLRDTYGVVSQEPVLFNGTIEYNIKYSNEDATDAEMRGAAEKACAIGFIEGNEFDVIGDEKEAAEKFGTGFQRKVGPKGSQMSGGQKQRIAIARAILKNPSMLILDEATSALDAQNEKTVQEALDKIMVNKTSIIVAHRISTIRDADEIIVFNDGQIIERGSYQDLNAMQGMFYKLERGMNLTV